MSGQKPKVWREYNPKDQSITTHVELPDGTRVSQTEYPDGRKVTYFPSLGRLKIEVPLKRGKNRAEK